MSRYTDIDIFLQKIEERYCKDCEKRKGMKNGKRQFVYEIGEVPCRACDVDDMKFHIDNAPIADVVPVVRCKDCIHSRPDEYGLECMAHYRPTKEDDFCSYGEKVAE